MADEDEGELICPYCGEVQQCHEPDEFSSHSCYTQCESCGKNFWYWVRVTRGFFAQFRGCRQCSRQSRINEKVVKRMREILFRGKRRSNSKWVEGFYLKHTTQTGERLENFLYEPYTDVEYNVIPETIGQFTGLTDKNGTKVFEGDIIAYEDESPVLGEYHDCFFMNRGEIRFCDGGFYFTNSIAATMEDLLLGDGKLNCEVIGNIHDNPEMFKAATGEDTGNAAQDTLLPAT